ncbi:hypothetical protein [Mycobacterium scrofulaceum]|uniref:hypothetical protein n=1 Tax=Mycobacterium scrofulaceum TaxID=1783 RepID=UPI00114EBB3B|nr:hypothetical protein [Mycobacterium scrofulaceum]
MAAYGSLEGMRGITVCDGGDLRLSNIQINFNDDGVESPSPTVHLRTDTWPYWLAEAVSAAVDAAKTSTEIPAAVAASNDDKIGRLMVLELRASMRALTSSAFAIDAFYASVKARSPKHPQQDIWHQNSTARSKQVAETLRYHLKVAKNESAKELRRRIKELFKYRDWAVHPGSKFREPIYREDLDAAVDWHFVVFSAANAQGGTYLAVNTLDNLVTVLNRGSEELVQFKPRAREAMDKILDVYESSEHLIPIVRSEPGV